MREVPFDPLSPVPLATAAAIALNGRRLARTAAFSAAFAVPVALATIRLRDIRSQF